MPYNFPPAPTREGLSYLDVKPIHFADHRTGQHAVFPVYHYQDDMTGELILVTEDRFEPILEKLISMGAFGPKVGRA